MTFAAITVALVARLGRRADEVSAVMVFAAIWLTIVYFPIAHMVWARNGYSSSLGALDFAGGTVVHINSGVSALVACLMLGKRIGYPPGADAAALADHDRDRHRPAVGRLVRLQRRLGARGQRRGAAWR